MDVRCLFKALLVGTIAVVGATAAQAENFPNKPINLVVGYAPGGGTDIYARAVASLVKDRLNGQPIVVVNKPGAGGLVGAKYVADSRADGYTLHLASAGAMYFGSQLRGFPLDPNNDLVMVSQVGRLLPALVVHKDSPLKTSNDLVAQIKANPGKIRYSTPGRGSTWATAGLAFNMRNDLDSKPVPFKGGSKARAAVIGKQVDYTVIGLHLVRGFEDQIKPLGLIFPERDAYNPDVPTLKEQGVAYTEVFTPMMIFAPAKTPPERVKYLDEALKKITGDPEYDKKMRKAGLPAKYLSGKEGTDYYLRLQKEWAPLVVELKKGMAKKK
jgi:tripartite-type tricarboxylate transporter receptor subunit TctC